MDGFSLRVAIQTTMPFNTSFLIAVFLHALVWSQRYKFTAFEAVLRPRFKMQPRSHQEVLGKFLGQKTKFVVINFKVEGGKI